MARRFKRENFLFPTDLDAERVQVAAAPVDAIVRASEGTIEQQPTRPYEVNRPSQTNTLIDLGRSLGVAAETAQRIGTEQYADYTERATAAGATLAAEDRARGNRQSFRQAVSTTRVNAGDEAARELMRLSPHVKNGFDETVARSSALDYNASLQAAFSANPEIAEGVRLHDIDVADPRYQQWVSKFTQEFQETNGLTSLNPQAQAALVPALQDTQNRVTLAQDELRSERRLEEYENSTAEFVNNTLFELNGNAAWLSGDDPDAQVLAANLITNQLDEAVKQGYGGSDLEAIYGRVVENVIALATTTNNPGLLDVLNLVEVGRPEDRDLLLDRANGGKYRMAVSSASQQISDRQFQEGQRDRQLRDQKREDSMNETLEKIAVTAGMYEQLGRTPAAREALEAVVESGRVVAAENGFTVEYNSVVGRVLQEGVDNQGVPVVDYPAMAALEHDIINGQISGEAAQVRLREMYMSGDLGNNQQAADNMLRIGSKIKADSDQNYAQAANAVGTAAEAYAAAYEARMGYTTDEYGRQRSVRETLISEGGFTEQNLPALMSYTPEQLEQYITANAEAAAQNRARPFSPALIAAMRLVVIDDVNPMNIGAPPDPGEVEQKRIEFENAVLRGLSDFREQNGRDMLPAERDQYIRDQSAAMLTGQRAELPATNPLSSVNTNVDGFQGVQNSLYNQTLEGVSAATGNPRAVVVLDEMQVVKALEHNMLTGSWHPEIVTLARNNNMTPMELVQRQSALHGAEIDPDLAISIGIPTAPQATATFTGMPGSSSVARNANISGAYAPGQYVIHDGRDPNFSRTQGDYHEGYDFTLEQNGRVNVNVPAPFDGTVKHVGNDADGWGNYVIIQDRSTGQQVLLAHAEAVYLRPGDRFSQGQAVMKQGSTGRSSSEHVHLEILDRNGGNISNTGYTNPLYQQYSSYIQNGTYLPSANSTGLPGASGGGSGSNLRAKSNQGTWQSIQNSASRLGVAPDELAAVLALESGLDVNARGGDGDRYVGLWQANPDVQSRYGVYQGMPAGQQMAALETYLRDRGYRPGMGITALYSTILAGNPYDINSTDSNTTSAAGAAAQFRRGGRHWDTAAQVFGW